MRANEVCLQGGQKFCSSTDNLLLRFSHSVGGMKVGVSKNYEKNLRRVSLALCAHSIFLRADVEEELNHLRVRVPWLITNEQ